MAGLWHHTKGEPATCTLDGESLSVESGRTMAGAECVDHGASRQVGGVGCQAAPPSDGAAWLEIEPGADGSRLL